MGLHVNLAVQIRIFYVKKGKFTFAPDCTVPANANISSIFIWRRWYMLVNVGRILLPTRVLRSNLMIQFMGQRHFNPNVTILVPSMNAKILRQFYEVHQEPKSGIQIAFYKKDVLNDKKASCLMESCSLLVDTITVMFTSVSEPLFLLAHRKPYRFKGCFALL